MKPDRAPQRPEPPASRADRAQSSGSAQVPIAGYDYSRMRRLVVLAIATVALVPLTAITAISYQQYQSSIKDDSIEHTRRLTANNKQALEFFLSERRAALEYLVNEHSFETLCDRDALKRIIINLNDSFEQALFVDLGIINSDGEQVCYYGPHDLTGHSYAEAAWFVEVVRRGKLTSDVFLGHRNSPHYTIATRHKRGDSDFYVLRATFDAHSLNARMHTSGLGLEDDLFLVNRDGILQTPSRRYKEILAKIPLDVPAGTTGLRVALRDDERGKPVVLGAAVIADSPFVLMFIEAFEPEADVWSVPTRLFVFWLISSVLVMLVSLWGSRQFVRRLRHEITLRETLMHQIEYQNKLASIGRLASGVAHEINNPLAIINEKAGLLKDLLSIDEAVPKQDKYLKLVDSVIGSVSRCTRITRRLLGFAKHMDVQTESLDLPELIREVIGFLEKEIEYRNIAVSVVSHADNARIESDRGQLQQVFLNLINNAVSAVEDGGRIDIEITTGGEDQFRVSITDDGQGIPQENLERIFEPFFTTKQGSGTGLGLSITYGIVQKLGGDISVTSEVGQGTCFTVKLPTARADAADRAET